MAHFCKLGIGNIVEQVVVVSNDIATSEQAGIDFLNTLFKTNDVWKQTYIDGRKRQHYAGVGGRYDKDSDIFTPVKPYPSWTLNANFVWEPPVSLPEDADEVSYYWNESTQVWNAIA